MNARHDGWSLGLTNRRAVLAQLYAPRGCSWLRGPPVSCARLWKHQRCSVGAIPQACCHERPRGNAEGAGDQARMAIRGRAPRPGCILCGPILAATTPPRHMRIQEPPARVETSPRAARGRAPGLLLGAAIGILGLLGLGAAVGGPYVLAKRGDLPLERVYGDFAVSVASRIGGENRSNPLA